MCGLDNEWCSAFYTCPEEKCQGTGIVGAIDSCEGVMLSMVNCFLSRIGYTHSCIPPVPLGKGIGKSCEADEECARCIFHTSSLLVGMVPP